MLRGAWGEDRSGPEDIVDAQGQPERGSGAAGGAPEDGGGDGGERGGRSRVGGGHRGDLQRGIPARHAGEAEEVLPPKTRAYGERAEERGACGYCALRSVLGQDRRDNAPRRTADVRRHGGGDAQLYRGWGGGPQLYRARRRR